MKTNSFQRLALSGLGALFLVVVMGCGKGGTGSGTASFHRAVSSACSANPGAGDQCLTDTECGPTTGVCNCKGETFGWSHVSVSNVCVPSNCRADADCGKASACSPTVSFDCGSFYGVRGYYCHTPRDTCVNDADCASGQGYCAYSTALGYWACSYGHCAG